MKNLQTISAQRTQRTFMLTDNEGRIIAQDLDIYTACDLLGMLATHNGISSWTLVTQSLVEEDDGGRQQQEEDDEYGDREKWYAE